MAEKTSWLPIAEAARVMGLSDQALRKRLARGTVESRKNNKGRMVVLVSHGDETMPELAAPASNNGEAPASNTGLDRVKGQGEPMVPLAVMNDALDRLERQHGVELERQDARHSAELARLERAYKAATDTLMARVSAVLLAHRERRPWWWPW